MPRTRLHYGFHARYLDHRRRTPPTLLDPWVWRMAWRDSRRSRGRLLVFSTALTLGVAALVAIGSLGWNLQRAIHEQARTLVGADLVIQGTDARSTPARRNSSPVFPATARADETHLTSMSTFPNNGGVSPDPGAGHRRTAYPFYGKIETDPPQAAQAFADGKGALVEESLLHPIRTNTPATSISRSAANTHAHPRHGPSERLPGEASAFASIAPRVLIPRAELSASLVVRGSLVRYIDLFENAARARTFPNGSSDRMTRTKSTRAISKSDTVSHRENAAWPCVYRRERVSSISSASSPCCSAASASPARSMPI